MREVAKMSKAKLVDMYEKMVLIRYHETRAAECFAAGMIPGFVHLYVGEEAVAVGACASLREDDFITSTHRGHGHCIAKGCDVKYMFAELLGKQTGYCKGKGGSMHIADIEIGMLGANGIVGAGIPLACGAALSAQIRGTDQVCVSFFGDGASNQGTFHESLNLASIWRLPIVFVAENNMYAQTTPQKVSMNVASIAERGAAYGMPSAEVDGNDVIAVYEAVGQAVKRAREGQGPTLVECLTYRWRGHFEGDAAHYRTHEEFDDWKKKDPITRFRKKLIETGIMKVDESDGIDKACLKEVERAIEFAEKSPYPEPDEVIENVYVAYP